MEIHRALGCIGGEGEGLVQKKIQMPTSNSLEPFFSAGKNRISNCKTKTGPMGRAKKEGKRSKQYLRECVLRKKGRIWVPKSASNKSWGKKGGIGDQD